MDYDGTLKKLVLELRRGVLALSVLSQLRVPQYGYSLLQTLSTGGMEIDQNTLYPLLRRLEDQGLLDSDWSTDGPRPRRYYVLSEAGLRALRDITLQWEDMVRTLNALLAEEEERHGSH